MKHNGKDLLYHAIEKFLNEGNTKKLEKIAQDLHSWELHNYIKEWPINKLVNFFNILGPELSANVFREFNVDTQIELIETFSDREIQEIFSEFYTDESVDILEEFPYKVIQKVLNTLDLKSKMKINKIFTFAKHQAGFHMTIDYVSIKDNGQTVREIKIQLRKEISEKENEIIGNIFVIDNQDKLIGYIKPDSIFVAKDKDNISGLIEKIASVRATQNITMAEEIMSKYDVPSAPVVDNNGVLLGIIEAEDIIEKYEEIEESFLESSNIKLANVSYMSLTAWQIFKSRVWWIVALLFIGSITQIVIIGFQSIWSNADVWSSDIGEVAGTIAFSSIVTLALVNSLSVASSVNDSAGNSGSQTSATIVRSLAMGEITKKDYGKVIYKELKVSIYIGFAAAISAFIRMFLVWGILGYLSPNVINQIANQYLPAKSVGWVLGWYSIIALVSSVTFFISIIIGNLTGVVLPIIAHVRNSDGAVISGPVQTTIVDILTFTVYLSITTAIFIPLANSGYFDIDQVSSLAIA